jgi:DNA-binding response OmpR family regulator
MDAESRERGRDYLAADIFLTAVLRKVREAFVLAVYFAPSGIVGVLKADEAKSNWPLQARARRASGSLGQIRSQLSLRRETRLFHMRAAREHCRSLDRSQPAARLRCRAAPRDHLYGGSDDEPEAKIIDVFICKLRKKLANASGGQDYIETIWGRGYALREPTKQAIAS